MSHCNLPIPTIDEIKLWETESYIFPKVLLSADLDVDQAASAVKFCACVKKFQLSGHPEKYNEWMSYLREALQKNHNTDLFLSEYIDNAFVDNDPNKLNKFVTAPSAEYINIYREKLKDLYVLVQCVIKN